MKNYENIKFNCIENKSFKNIISKITSYLQKSKMKSIDQYVSIFTLFLKYLDKNDLLFKNISQKYILDYMEKLSMNRRYSLKKIMVFLIKSGYLSRDDFNKYNNDKSKVDYYINEYLVYLKISGRRERTVLKHKKTLEKFFKYLKTKEKILLNNITRDIIEEYMFELYNLKNKKTGKKLSISSLVTYMLSVKVYFRYLIKENHIIYNPSEFIKLPKLEKKITSNYFTKEEIKKVFNGIKIKTISNYRMIVLFEILYNFGLRINEAIHLKVSDINFETGMVHVREAKGGYERSVPMSNYIKKYLEIYIEYAYNTKFENKESYLFFNPKTKKLITIPYFFGVILKNTVKKLGINKKISSHAFRKSIGKHLLENGLDIRYVKEFLGHKCINATQSYTILNIQDLKQAIEKYHPREIEKEKYILKAIYRG